MTTAVTKTCRISTLEHKMVLILTERASSVLAAVAFECCQLRYNRRPAKKAGAPLLRNCIVLYAPVKPNHSLYDKHKTIVDNAIKAVHKREFFAQYPEMPSPQVYGETAEADQKKTFEGQLNHKFERLKQGHDTWMLSDEQSPYTQEKLGISYPTYADANSYVKKSLEAWSDWKRTDVKTRTGILVETLERLKTHFHEIAFATMHTTGQSYMMSFQASGPHAADRALKLLGSAIRN